MCAVAVPYRVTVFVCDVIQYAHLRAKAALDTFVGVVKFFVLCDEFEEKAVHETRINFSNQVHRFFRNLLSALNVLARL